jgi:hypothetical protein
MTTVYLIGPINGCTDAEANDWRSLMKSLLPGYTILDPMRRDYRGREMEPGIAGEIVGGDLDDCEACDVAVAFRPKPSDGSAMEQFYCHRDLGKPVVAIVPAGVTPSPWTVHFSTVRVATEREAADWIKANHPCA